MADEEQLVGGEIDDATQQSSTVYNAILASSFNAFKAYAPQIVPLIVCTLLIPLVLAISLLAGWLVWKNACVSWEAPIYLQYGYASFSFVADILHHSLQVMAHSHMLKSRCLPWYRNRDTISRYSLTYPSLNQILRSVIS